MRDDLNDGNAGSAGRGLSAAVSVRAGALIRRLRVAKAAGEATGWADKTSLGNEEEPTGARKILVLSFLLCVLVPSLAILLYQGLFATREYVAEARITIRTAHESTSTALDSSSILSRFGIATASSSNTQDAFIVVEYIRGRSIIGDVGGRHYLETIYSGVDVDWLSRMGRDLSLEKIWQYWRDKVDASEDIQSNIITLKVRAFSAEAARDLAQSILTQSEKLVNSLSNRSETDTLEHANEELRLSMKRLLHARQELVGFRNRTLAVDPAKHAASIGELIASLTMEKIDVQNNVAMLSTSLSAQSSTQKTQMARIAAINQQLATLQSQLTDQSNKDTISSQLAEYEQLKLNETFAERLYSIAESASDKARQEILKQKLFVAVIVPPTLPEDWLYPKVATDFLLAFAICLVFWGIGALVTASVRDHMV